MTVLIPKPAPCPLCGQIGEQMEMVSTTTFGASDLDLRPPELLRSTLSSWVSRCDECGYVRPSGDEGSEPIPGEPIARQLVESPAYRDQLSSDDFPALANTFLCRVKITEAAGLLDQAALAALHAAWACDDEGDEPAATECRSLAYDLLQQALSADLEIFHEPDAHWLVMADLLRRSGRFEEGRELCSRALKGQISESVATLLEYELELLDRRDRATHRVDETGSL